MGRESFQDEETSSITDLGGAGGGAWGPVGNWWGWCRREGKFSAQKSCSRHECQQLIS